MGGLFYLFLHKSYPYEIFSEIVFPNSAPVPDPSLILRMSCLTLLSCSQTNCRALIVLPDAFCPRNIEQLFKNINKDQNDQNQA